MGDYGFYIWSAYGFAGLLVLLLTLACLRDYRTQQRALARLEERNGPSLD